MDNLSCKIFGHRMVVTQTVKEPQNEYYDNLVVHACCWRCKKEESKVVIYKVIGDR